MSTRPWALSRSHLRVLEHFCAFPEERHSTRRTAQALNFSCSTVQLAIDTLNAKQLIRTIGGNRTEASLHVVAPEVFPVLARCTDFGAGRVPISGHPVPLVGVPISGQVPAGVPAKSPLPPSDEPERYINARAALTHSLTQVEETNENAGESEVSDMVRSLLSSFRFQWGPMPESDPAPARLASLARSMDLPPPELLGYLHELKKRDRYLQHAGAVEKFARDGGLVTWHLRRFRKPPARQLRPDQAAIPVNLDHEISELERTLAEYRGIPDLCRHVPALEQSLMRLRQQQQPLAMAAGGRR